MKEVVEYIVKCLVDNQDAVDVSVEEKENGETVVHINVAEEDMGRVIGKSGKVAGSIRTIAKSISGKEHKKIFVKFGE